MMSQSVVLESIVTLFEKLSNHYSEILFSVVKSGVDEIGDGL